MKGSGTVLGIVPCSKEKIWDIHPQKQSVPASKAYRSAFHAYARKYARHHCHQYVILSAKYGIMEPDFLIHESYDVTFSRPQDPYVSTALLAKQARRYHSMERVLVLCPQLYAQRIEAAFEGLRATLIFPLRGIGGFGEMHRFLKTNGGQGW